MIVIVSKVQVRRGLESELPGSPTSIFPLALGPALDVGELGFTEDTSRLFVGFDPTISSPNFMRPVFPYENIEVLTESSPRNQELFSEFVMDQNEGDFFVPVPIGNATSMSDILYPAGVLNPAQLIGSITSATFEYHAFATSGAPVKQGLLRVVGSAGSTAITDTEFVQAVSGLTFGIRRDTSGTFFMLQCANQTGSSINLYLRRVVVTGG
jgi:hypothetical protein